MEYYNWNFTNESDWFQSTRQAIIESGKPVELWAVLETFTSDENPMPVNEMVKHMEIGDGFVSKITSYSFNEYNSPSVAPPWYYQTYLEYVNNGFIN